MQDGLEGFALGCQGIFDSGQTVATEHVALNEARRFQIAKLFRQGRLRNSGGEPLQFAKALWCFAQIINENGLPFSADQAHAHFCWAIELLFNH